MTTARINEAYAFLSEAVPQKPEVCVVLGSGLGGYADTFINPTIIPYKDIPGFRYRL